jgi:signal transduction histidine kinase
VKRIGETGRTSRLIFAVVFFAMTMILRSLSKHPGDAVLSLNAVPVAIVAFEYGVKGGLIAAALAFGSVLLWSLDRPVSELGYMTRGGTYFVTGIVVGLFADRLREAQSVAEANAARVGQMQHEREQARRATEEQRTRLARELHDVIAHSVSVMTVQAAAARRVLERSPEEAEHAVAEIERTGREALAEMRRMVAVLRPADEPGRELEPQPGVEDLAALIEQMEAAGLRVRLHVEGDRHSLPSSLDLSAYRIVQEALTNVLKHAGPVAVDVTLRYEGGALEVEVADEGPGGGSPGAQPAPAGHGLIGMRERAALFGGELSTMRTPGGGFQVRARLPLESAS